MSRRMDSDHLTPLRDDIVELLRSTGSSEDVALRLASDIIDALRHRYGGERIYVGKYHPPIAVLVRRDFNGSNHDQVCARYQISRSTLWRYIHAEEPK